MATKNPEKTDTETPEPPPETAPEAAPETEPETEQKPEAPDYKDLEIIGAGGDNSPKKTGSKPKKTGDVGGEELAELYQVVYGVAAARFGAHWQLQKKEAQALGEATDQVLEKYGAKAQLGPELSLALVLAMTTGPRIMATKAQSQGPGEAGADRAGETPDGS